MKESRNFAGGPNPSEMTGDYKTPLSDRPIAQIFQEILNRAGEIVRSEIRLATLEVRRDLEKYLNASVYLIAGGMAALYALGFFLLGLVYALANTMPAWLAAILVAAAAGIAGAGLFFTGRNKIRRLSLKPDVTIQTLEDNVTWIKKQTK